jgi:RNase adapter protein RapZ
MQLIIVSGLSGAGKSIALDTLEDLGFYCVDNLPIPLLPVLAEELKKTQSKNRDIAVGIDARNDPQSLGALPGILEQLERLGFECEIFFLEADEGVLIQRFSETRRKHPLTDTTGSLPKAIELERSMLTPLMDRADLRIDTRNTHVHQLRQLLREHLRNRIRGQPVFAVYVLRFQARRSQ